MIIPITLNVKESAYDKIIYFLSHLKDDVMIVNKNFRIERKPQNSTNQKYLEEFRELSKKISSVDKNIDILSLDKDINSDIF